MATIQGSQSDKQWFKDVTRSTMEHFRNAKDLSAAELAAIREECPRYNVAGYGIQPTRSWFRSDGNKFRCPDEVARVRTEPYPCILCGARGLVRGVDRDGNTIEWVGINCLHCDAQWTDDEWDDAVRALVQQWQDAA